MAGASGSGLRVQGLSFNRVWGQDLESRVQGPGLRALGLTLNPEP